MRGKLQGPRGRENISPSSATRLGPHNNLNDSSAFRTLLSDRGDSSQLVPLNPCLSSSLHEASLVGTRDNEMFEAETPTDGMRMRLSLMGDEV